MRAQSNADGELVPGAHIQRQRFQAGERRQMLDVLVHQVLNEGHLQRRQPCSSQMAELTFILYWTPAETSVAQAGQRP